MTKLEHIFLMNVVLYLRDYHDISTFMKINKKSQEVVKSMRINPYFTSRLEETSNRKILKARWYFPQLETLQIQLKDLRFVNKFYHM